VWEHGEVDEYIRRFNSFDQNDEREYKLEIIFLTDELTQEVKNRSDCCRPARARKG
jgi:hypothetical protein